MIGGQATRTWTSFAPPRSRRSLRSAFAVVLRTIDAVGTFDQIFVLTKGGPGTATQLISIYAYNTAFLFNQYGRAMAMLIGVLAFLIVLMTVAVRLMGRTSEKIA